MKQYYIIILIALFALSAHAQIVYIPDPIFKAYLLGATNININQDTSIQVSEAASFSGELNVGYRGISDLTGIEAFTAITTLFCSRNNLTSLNVSSCNALNSLSCYQNNLTSLNVSSDTAITYLECSFNKLTSLDVSSCKSLKDLECAYNYIKSLDLSSNKAIIKVECDANPLTSLNLSSDTLLVELYCGANSLTSLDLSSNTALEVLHCYYDSLTSLNLSNNVALTELYCWGNGLTSLDLSSNTALWNLDCNSNSLRSLNVKNGNNHNMLFTAFDNPDLNCIQVDDSAYSTANWNLTMKDSWAHFSADCHYLGVNNLATDDGINIYPNPFMSNFIIEIKAKRATINIYNMLGEIINTQTVAGNEKIIDMNGEPPGIYYIMIKADNERAINKKIVKQ